MDEKGPCVAHCSWWRSTKERRGRREEVLRVQAQVTPSAHRRPSNPICRQCRNAFQSTWNLQRPFGLHVCSLSLAHHTRMTASLTPARLYDSLDAPPAARSCVPCWCHATSIYSNPAQTGHSEVPWRNLGIFSAHSFTLMAVAPLSVLSYQHPNLW